MKAAHQAMEKNHRLDKELHGGIGRPASNSGKDEIAFSVAMDAGKTPTSASIQNTE
jgi:hypothetical protein